MGRRGWRKPAEEMLCTRCGLLRTKDNTYTRKDGTLLNICKRCSTDDVYERLLKRDSTEKLKEKLRQLERQRAFIEKELSRR